MALKRCNACSQSKAAEEYGKSKSTKDGLKCYCRICTNTKQRTFAKTSKGLAIKRRVVAKESNKAKARESLKRFRKTDKAKPIKQRYQQSAGGRETSKTYHERIKGTPEWNARSFLNHQIGAGKFPRVSTKKCAVGIDCAGRMEYHHHQGYEREYWLDVVPLCRKHHVEADAESAV